MEKVQKNLADGNYIQKDQFKRDLVKIFENARTYNQQETIYYKYANQLESIVRPMLDRLKETEVEKEGQKEKKRNSQGTRVVIGTGGLGMMQNEESGDSGQLNLEEKQKRRKK